MAISAEDKNFLVSLYVGYFNRAPDPAGLQFWIDQVEAGRDTNTIAADFAASPEAKSLYSFLTTPDVSSPTSFITAVYANLFNRAPDAAGQAFWEAQLSSGAVSPADAIDAIIKGATTAPDATILANKNIVGLDFATDAGNTPGFTFDLDGTSGSAAKDAISGVTEDSATVTAAQAATDAYLSGVANIGQTFTLTTGTDNINGNAGGNDTFTAAQDTYTSNDVIFDASSTDNDVLNLAATSDIANTPTVVGVENMNVSFTGFTAGGNTDLSIAMTDVGATKLNVTASGSTAVTSATIDAVATGTEITTGAAFKTVNLTAVDDNAAVIMNTSATSATTTSTVNVTAAATGALTELTVNETVGHVDVNVTAGDLDGTLTVTGAKDVDVEADSAKTVVINSGEDVVITSLTKATSVEITAAKDVSDAGDDLLDAATTLSITAGGRVNGVDFDAAETVTIAAAGVDTSATGGSDKSSTITGDALETLNVSGNGAALEINVDDMSDTLKTINVSGDQAVTVEMNAATIAAATELALNNAGTGAVTLALGNATLAGNIDLKKVATTAAIRMDVNEASGDVIAVASGAGVTFNAAQTNVAFTADAATAATNTLSLNVDKANATTSTYAIGTLTTTNIKTVNLDLSVDTADTTLGTVDVGAANNLSVSLGANKLTAVTDVVATTLTLTGSGDVALADLTIGELNASAMTGEVSYQIGDGDVVRTGSADDTLTVGGAAIHMYVESGAGNDSLSFGALDYSTKTVTVNLGEGSLDAVTVANGADISGAAVSITGVEKFTFSGDATVNDTLLNGSSAAIFGGADTDVTIVLTQNSNDFSSLAIDTATISAADGDSFIIDASTRTAAQSIVGTDASDVITGSNTGGVFADTLNGGDGNDTIKVTEGGDSVTGGAGTDTIDFTVIDGDFTTIEGSASTATGMIVNLGTTAVSATTVAVNASGNYISKSLTEIGAGKFGYMFGTDATTNSTVLGTVASVENVTGSDGADYIVGSASANEITGGAGADTLTGGLGADAFVITTGITADTVTDFTAGTDDIHFSLASLNAAGAITAAETDTLITFGAAAAAPTDTAAATTEAIGTIDDDAGVHADILNANVIILHGGATTFANVGAAVDAFEDSGNFSITHQSNIADDDTFIFAYENSTTGVVHIAAASFEAADDNSAVAATIADGALKGTDLVVLTGVTDVTTLTAADFNFIA